MTNTHNPEASTRTTPRRPTGPRTNAGNTLARPASPRPLQPTETDLSTNHGRPLGTAATPARRPGDWPANCQRPGRDDQAERARRETALASIAEELAEQPSARAVRAAGRRWCLYITQLTDDIATAKQKEVAAK